jgi:hypothetical protein
MFLKSMLGALALSVVPISSQAEVTHSRIKAEIAVVCPTPGMVAYLESPFSPTRFSPSWKAEAGRAHCRSLKSDRPLIVTKLGSTSFRDHEYSVAEVVPTGVIFSTDGFAGPYYIISTQLRAIPNSEEIRENVKSLLPTSVNYSVDGIDGPSAPALAPH